MKKILLLNPPSNRLCIKDYYCSFSSKTEYCWPPQDLVVLSGIIGSRHRVDYLDPYAYNYNFDQSLETIIKGNYDAVVFTTGSVNLSGDLAFIKRIKEGCPGIKVIGSSSVFHFIGTQIMNTADFIDGILLDFTNSDVLFFLAGDYAGIKNMLYRKHNAKFVYQQNARDGAFSFPVPLHGLFDYKHYKLPFFVFKNNRFITTISSLGCPLKCKFCVAANIKYRQREVSNLMEELLYLRKHSVVKNIFFADCNFTVDQKRLQEICGRMLTDCHGTFNWICNSRVEPLLEPETVRLLKLAGCRMVMLGAESADQRTLDKYNKNISVQQIKESVKNCRKNGIYTLLYFILGLPGEDKDSLKNTTDFISRLNCDFISISFAVPDFGTSLREESLKHGWCLDELGGWDHSTNQYLSGNWSNGELEQAKNAIYRKFYLKPSWILHKRKELSSLRLMDLKEGIKILKNWL